LNRLLATALEIEGAQRTAWLESLGDDDRHLQAVLIDLLTQSEATGFAGATEPPTAVANMAAQALAAMRREQPGDRIGPWQLERLVAEGGMGAVWVAQRADGVMQFAPKACRRRLAGRRRCCAVHTLTGRRTRQVSEVSRRCPVWRMGRVSTSKRQSFELTLRLENIMNKSHLPQVVAAFAAVITTLVVFSSVASLADQDKAALAAAQTKATVIAQTTERVQR